MAVWDGDREMDNNGVRVRVEDAVGVCEVLAEHAVPDSDALEAEREAVQEAEGLGAGDRVQEIEKEESDGVRVQVDTVMVKLRVGDVGLRVRRLREGDWDWDEPLGLSVQLGDRALQVGVTD